ncbi:MAG TPA: hypothetical protein VIA80_03185 [Hyphomonadaceae bacterium]
MKQVFTKVGLSVLTALTGGAAWMIAEPGAQSLMSAMFKPAAPTAEAAEVAEVTGLRDSQAANTSLGAAMEGLLNIARAANRPDIDLISLTAARARISELSAKIGGLAAGDEAALKLLNDDINATALAAARSEIAALSSQADKIGGSIRSDFLTAEKELAAQKKQLDADSARARVAFEEAMTGIKSAVVIAVGSDAASVIAAASNAEQAMVTLASLKSSGQSAFSKTKREAFNASIKTSRQTVDEIVALAAGKKASVFASRDRKADAKYLQDTAAWAKSRMAELDQAAAKISTADRKTLTQSAARAAEVSAELQAAVIHVREVSARLAATKS